MMSSAGKLSEGANEVSTDAAFLLASRQVVHCELVFDVSRANQEEIVLIDD